MRKTLLFLFLLSSSVSAFSQKGVSTKKFPFQVLFVDAASIFGRELKQYDYLTNDDLLNTKGNITIVHYSGEVFEFTRGKYWLDELVVNRPRNFQDRPIIDPTDSTSSNIYSRAPYCRMPTPEIYLVIPNYDIVDTYWNESIDLGWVLTDKEDYKLYKSFVIEFYNIYDHLIKNVEVNNDFFSFKPDTIGLNKSDTISLGVGLLIVSIKGKHNDEFTTGNFAFRLHDLGSELPEKPLDKNYSGLLDAIYYDHINDNKRANFLYMNQIRKSNQDPRFVKLYEDFLERNPELKGTSE